MRLSGGTSLGTKLRRSHSMGLAMFLNIFHTCILHVVACPVLVIERSNMNVYDVL